MSSTPPDDVSVARLFVGLWPGDAVREAVLAHVERWRWTRAARRVPRNKLHMTLHFLGAVPRERVAGLLDGLAVPFERFALQLDDAEVWHNGVAVLQPRVVPQALPDLHARLRVALAGLQQPAAHERWLPHVTLARKAKGATPPPAIEPIAWRVGGYALIESLPNSAYGVLREYR